ncbi:ankyrin repeat and sterile alpha motif domain-containing protein 1B-like isoform X1 [Agrilus planipennis]|uniref:Ankyrin repeat and sterile alpha motif domain-containing protein 1B-like isoform X1 n=1 Tax=Agrilus planipennis TaxID=224129 RepID=A0A1W4WXG8_AGRPL|nr:ankyrin repeat and sterile alpha motif domain-containing protein 1B-like isoform X1 [Agrilus planipennis]
MSAYEHLLYYAREIVNIKKNLWPNWPNSLIDCLIKALHTGDVEKFKELVDNCLDINHPNERGFSLIHLVILVENLDILDILLQRPDINLNVQFLGETPLSLSLQLENFKEPAIKLINAGCDVTIPNDDFITPLQLAVSKNSLEVCEALVKHGANVNAADFYGATPLHEAVSDPVKVPIIQMLLFYGADPTYRCDDGYTPFMRSLHSYDAAMELLEYEVDFNISTKDHLRSSTLLLALSFKNPIAFEIIKRGGDVNYVSTLGDHPLQDAIFWKDPTMFKELWLRMDKEVIFCTSFPILDLYFSEFCHFNVNEWIDCLYEIFESDIAFDIVDSYVCLTRNPFSSVIEGLAARMVPKEDRIKIIYLFLSHSMPVESNDVYLMYKHFGYNEEVEALLLTEIDQSPFTVNSCLLPSLLLTIHSDVNTIVKSFIEDYVPTFSFPYFLKEVLLMFQYCTPTEEFKTVYFQTIVPMIDFVDNTGWGSSNKEIKELNSVVMSKLYIRTVPSLLEIARNATRTIIISKYEIKDFFQLQKTFNCLGLPKSVIDILVFKLPIYDE